jgi:hypothetical protein
MSCRGFNRFLACTLVWLAIIACLPDSQALAAEGVLLRTSLEPQEAWVGQKVVLYIDVLAKEGWAQLKKMGQVNIKGAYLIRLETQGTRLNETIDGESYSGQRYELLLFAQRPGWISLPQIQLQAEVKTWGGDGGSKSVTLSSPVASLMARIPPGTEDASGLISSGSFTASQAWQPLAKHVTVGDAITRTITLQANDVAGMAFAPLKHQTLPGVRVYPAEPTVQDSYNRGELKGTRMEKYTYVFVKPGNVKIPALKLPWWDIKAEELKTIELPGLQLKVKGNPTEMAKAASGVSQQDRYWLWGILFGVVSLLLTLLLLYRRKALAGWQRWRRKKRGAEARYLRSLIRSLRTRDPLTILRHLHQWLDRIDQGPAPARLDLFLARYGDGQARDAVDELYRCLRTGNKYTGWKSLSINLSTARNRWRKTMHRRRSVNRVLPQLNGRI